MMQRAVDSLLFLSFRDGCAFWRGHWFPVPGPAGAASLIAEECLYHSRAGVTPAGVCSLPPFMTG